MSLRLISFLLLGALPVLAACQNNTEKVIPPGLEPLYAPRAAPLVAAEEPPPPAPVPPPPEALPFPTGSIAPEQAEILLVGDPMALRFLAIKQLAALGLVPPGDAGERREANLGALLPMTATASPAANLDQPIPSLAGIVGRFSDPKTSPGERAFLLDALLPRIPTQRQAYVPRDIATARQIQDRLDRLDQSGLITPDEHTREAAALDQLIAGGTLPQVLAPPAPPPPPPPAKKTRSGRGNRVPGGVSGRLEVIPSPPGVTAPKLAANAKGPAGLHLLSMGTATHGDKAWEALQKDNPELAGLGHVVVRTDLGDLGVTYRLIAGPVDAAQAPSLCAAIAVRGQDCTPTPFPATGPEKK